MQRWGPEPLFPTLPSVHPATSQGDPSASQLYPLTLGLGISPFEGRTFARNKNKP